MFVVQVQQVREQLWETVEIPQLQLMNSLDTVVDTPVVAQMQIPVVRLTTEILQLQYIDKVVDVCCAGPAIVDRLLHARCVQRQDPVVDDVAQFIDGVDVPVIMQ